MIPKHKGTEKLQADLKSKISRIKESLEHGHKGGGAPTAWYQVDRQGAGQVVIVGLPNSGKSALLNALTNTRVEVADYPFTTGSPQVGMMPYQDILIQIVDTPPVSETAQAWLYAIFRTADVLLVVLDASSDDLLEQYETLRAQLGERNVPLDDPTMGTPRVLVLLTKIDRDGARDNAQVFLDLCPGFDPRLLVSVDSRENLEALKEEIYRRLDIIRVYTKKIGHPPVRNDPVVLKAGTTVIDAAEHIHKDFKRNLQFTRLWNDDGLSGQRVEKTHVLKDGDIIEFHV